MKSSRRTSVPHKVVCVFDRLQVCIAEQAVHGLSRDGKVLMTYSVSTGKNGVGEQNGSECTPRGEHIIRAKIGTGQAENAVFVGRRPTGEQFDGSMRAQFPNRDWILTRILWLSGSEKGKNRLGAVDTMRRYIYFHGSPDDVAMGQPGSRGCIRMCNADMIDLFNRVAVGAAVNIS